MYVLYMYICMRHLSFAQFLESVTTDVNFDRFDCIHTYTHTYIHIYRSMSSSYSLLCRLEAGLKTSRAARCLRAGMYPCVYACMYVYRDMHRHALIHMHMICVRRQVEQHAAFKQVCIRVCMHVCMYTETCIDTHSCICIYTYAYIHMHMICVRRPVEQHAAFWKLCVRIYTCMYVTVTVTRSRIIYLNTSYRKAHVLPPSCPDYYADVWIHAHRGGFDMFSYRRQLSSTWHSSRCDMYVYKYRCCIYVCK